jgi:hypothetical protein
MAKRIQRKRMKGWRMPEGVVYVGRPTRFGNDWSVRDAASRGVPEPERRAWAVAAYRADLLHWMEGPHGWVEALDTLRGKDLACWCPLDQPCHADVLLELANRSGGSNGL